MASTGAAATDNAILSISSDALVLEAKKHLDFLQGLHTNGTTLATPSRDSLDRYVNFWLPLVAKEMGSGDKPLVPAPDIAWLWHCHRLATPHYERHVQHRFHKLVETPQHAFEFQDDKNTNSDNDKHLQTRALWDYHYPDKPFFLPNAVTTMTNSVLVSSTATAFNLDFFLQDFDLLESTKRQASFLWQVSGSRFSDVNFLDEGVKHYIMFLQLHGSHNRSNNNNSINPLVPTYQVCNVTPIFWLTLLFWPLCSTFFTFWIRYCTTALCVHPD